MDRESATGALTTARFYRLVGWLAVFIGIGGLAYWGVSYFVSRTGAGLSGERLTP